MSTEHSVTPKFPTLRVSHSPAPPIHQRLQFIEVLLPNQNQAFGRQTPSHMSTRFVYEMQ